MKRKNVDAVWHLRREDDNAQQATVPLEPRMQGECMVTLKQAAQAGMGIVALPAYVCRDEVKSGKLQRVLPQWVADKSSYHRADAPSKRHDRCDACFY